MFAENGCQPPRTLASARHRTASLFREHSPLVDVPRLTFSPLQSFRVSPATSQTSAPSEARSGMPIAMDSGIASKVEPL